MASFCIIDAGLYLQPSVCVGAGYFSGRLEIDKAARDILLEASPVARFNLSRVLSLFLLSRVIQRNIMLTA